MVQITTYHGTTQAFDRPDTSYLRVGEGASSYGAGFYVATHPEMVYDHLRERNNGTPVTNENFNGVIYEIDLDIPDERVVSRQDTFNPDDLNRFIDSADNIGDSDLANDLRDLQELMVNDGSYKYDTSNRTNINRDTGSISVSEGRVSFNHLETFLDDTVGQEGTARVISNAGYDAIYSGNPGPQYEMYTVLNLAVLGKTRVFVTFGDGPLTKVAELEGDFTGPDADQAGNPGQLMQAHNHGLMNKCAPNQSEMNRVKTPSYANDFSP